MTNKMTNNEMNNGKLPYSIHYIRGGSETRGGRQYGYTPDGDELARALNRAVPVAIQTLEKKLAELPFDGRTLDIVITATCFCCSDKVYEETQRVRKQETPQRPLVILSPLSGTNFTGESGLVDYGVQTWPVESWDEVRDGKTGGLDNYVASFVEGSMDAIQKKLGQQ